jgi:signal transduction histidine kinase
LRRRFDRSVETVLRVPLLAKLLGANFVIVATTLVTGYFMSDAGANSMALVSVLGGALIVGTAVNVLLTHTALRPIREIETTVGRMWHGDTGARVSASRVADPDLEAVGHTLNSLLDRLERDREGMRALASEVVRAEDREHNRIARQLHESIAQSLASVTYQLAALAAKSDDRAVTDSIMDVRVLVGEILDEVDVLAHEVHPRVLHDLGLAAGLRALARDVSLPEIPVTVHVTGREESLRQLGHETASALFRIAQEAVQNALRHSAGTQIVVAIGTTDNRLVLRVMDNGKGFDVGEASRRRQRKGLFAMQQRAELINARLTIDTSPREGTRVQVTMPLGPATFTS